VKTHGNAYQSGFPDLFACSRRFGYRWIEVKKTPRFTQAQLNVFTQFASKGIGVWVLRSVSEYNLLFGANNWSVYLLKSRGITVSSEVKRIEKTGPEGEIQDAIIDQLTEACEHGPMCQICRHNNWYCLETYGNLYQSGLPDIYCCHRVFGSKWIECKNPKNYRFTAAQMDVFPLFTAHAVPIYIMTSVDDLPKLFERPNWQEYLK